MNTFLDLKLPQPIQQALEALNFTTPTPIQAEAIPIALTRTDLVGIAQTGTGKTAAFSIPTLMRLLEHPDKTALVLAPTRELAQQIELFWRQLTRFLPQERSVLLIGGMSMQPQIRGLRQNPRMVIATPGRLLDHLERGTAKLGKVEVLILDEADRMLDMGFAPQLSRILKFLPNKRQTLLFTATWAPETDELAKKYLHKPQQVTVGQVSQPALKISQSVIETTQQTKNSMLLDELNKREGPVLIFTRTQSRTDRVAKYLASYGVPVNRIHAGRTQGQRKNALAAFRAGDVRVLVATDIASRGIDVTGIAHVINYDLPQVPEDYIHRIGRTGRAGAEGAAISLVAPEERKQWVQIAKLLRSSGSSLPELKFEGPASDEKHPPKKASRHRFRRGGGSGRGKSGKTRMERGM